MCHTAFKLQGSGLRCPNGNLEKLNINIRILQRNPTKSTCQLLIAHVDTAVFDDEDALNTGMWIVLRRNVEQICFQDGRFEFPAILVSAVVESAGGSENRPFLCYLTAFRSPL